jgi:hypothetical protein
MEQGLVQQELAKIQGKPSFLRLRWRDFSSCARRIRAILRELEGRPR